MNALLSSPQRLPRELAEPLDPISETASHQKRILVVDDDAAYCRLCMLVLSQAGYAVETAADGLLGWEALRASDYDLLLTDIQMPGLDGLALAARVRFAGWRLPIIISSGSPGQLDAADVTQLEPAELLQKPFTVPELIRAVEHGLARAPEAQAETVHFTSSLLALADPHHSPRHWGLNE